VCFADKEETTFGKLIVPISRERIELHGVVTLKKSWAKAAFPVLTVANDCFPMYSEHGQVKPEAMLDVVVATA